MRRKKPEDEERALAEADADVARAGPRLRESLASKRALTVARAARVIQKHRLDGFDDDLKAAFARFEENGDKADPSCHAKLAILEALDYGESPDERPFPRAVAIVQLEPVWGGKADTAAGVRARGIVALARLGHDELELLAARLLVDKERSLGSGAGALEDQDRRRRSDGDLGRDERAPAARSHPGARRIAPAPRR